MYNFVNKEGLVGEITEGSWIARNNAAMAESADWAAELVVTLDALVQEGYISYQKPGGESFVSLRVTGAGESKLVGEMRPRVIVESNDLEGKLAPKLECEGLLLGVSLTGDGNAIELRIPEQNKPLRPLAVETLEGKNRDQVCLRIVS
jgi:hypothetical protein